MKDKLTGWYIRGQMKLWDWKERFFSEEKGASHMVEIVVVIVVVIAIAAVFNKQLKAAVEAVFGNLTSFVNESDHSGISNGG